MFRFGVLSLTMIEKIKYFLQNIKLDQIFFVFSLVLLSLFSTILILSYTRFNDYKVLTTKLTNTSIPKMIKIANIYAHVKEFVYLNEKIRSSTSDIDRRITYQQITYKIFLINKFEMEVFNNKELELEFSNIKNEFEALNKIIQNEILTKDKIKKRISKLYKLNNDYINDTKEQDKYALWKKEFLEDINLAFQSYEEQDEKNLKKFKKRIETKYKFLLENKKTDKHNKYLKLYQDGILGQDGLLTLKIKEANLKDKSIQIERLVKSMIQSFVDKIEELSIKENNTLLKQSKADSYELQVQLKYVVAIVFIGLLCLIFAIMYLRIRIVKRLVILNESVIKVFKGDKKTITDNYNDEISSITNTFNFFVAKVREQNKDLKELSLTDGLTNIANRRFFDIRFKNELGIVKRYENETSILMMDVDNFKPYNDNYGHTKGDECLKLIATSLKKIVKRDIDLVARYGGEEFVCILSNTSQKKACVVANKILNAVAKLNILHEYNGKFNHITISIGIATITKDKVELEKAHIDNADKALYEAKKNGKNQAIHFNDIK